MALSMDEQRMLAEIEARLSAEDPGLAARLSSFRRPTPAVRLHSTRVRVIGSLCTVALVAVISVMVYVMIPFRAQTTKSPGGPQTTTQTRPALPGTAANFGVTPGARSPAVDTSASGTSSPATTVTTSTTATRPSSGEAAGSASPRTGSKTLPRAKTATVSTADRSAHAPVATP